MERKRWKSRVRNQTEVFERECRNNGVIFLFKSGINVMH